MYSNKLAFAIKNSGNILREDKDVVKLPFGSEYSLFIKNMNTKRAIVNITIDGQKVCSGGFVVNANDTIDIERFVKNNDIGNRFKFIERTTNVEKSRGIGIEDGIIRVEFQYEKEPNYPIVINHGSPYIQDSTWHEFYGQGMDSQTDYSTTITTSSVIATNASTKKSKSKSKSKSVLRSNSASVNDAGITVAGSVSEQKFKTVSDFPVENVKHVIILKLVGVTEDADLVQIIQPSRKKKTCTTCERKNKASAKFCAECGTSLNII